MASEGGRDDGRKSARGGGGEGSGGRMLTTQISRGKIKSGRC